ncbi:MAG: lysylphosphatidylglycerol synthase transmembrane domain-containing protein [Xenococcaceae cyanobacterium MO_167.B27]|nr:lysylphosphatidylglycerol synthase transmembrane domain-containing protein [Xenococcaceae cyanobacterium MO_167.B27]
MKYIKFLFLGLGFALLSLILRQTNLKEVWQHITLVGWLGMTIVIIFYFLEFLSDICTWQLTFNSIPMTLKWTSRLFLIYMVGAAFNRVTPLASLGGEGFKAVMLKTHYQIGYQETSASIILTKTLNTLSLLIFVAIGFFPLLISKQFSASFKTVTAVSFAVFACCIVIFFLVQRFRLASWMADRLGHSPLGDRLVRLLSHLCSVDDLLVEFYTNPSRMRNGLIVGFLNWPLGVLEIYFLMQFLRHPISFTDAWLLDSVAQLVRAGTFFIPANIGTLEGSLVVLGAGITGSPTLGLTISVIRRFKDLLGILVGLLIWWLFSFKPTLPEPPTK